MSKKFRSAFLTAFRCRKEAKPLHRRATIQSTQVSYCESHPPVKTRLLSTHSMSSFHNKPHLSVVNETSSTDNVNGFTWLVNHLCILADTNNSAGDMFMACLLTMSWYRGTWILKHQRAYWKEWSLKKFCKPSGLLTVLDTCDLEAIKPQSDVCYLHQLRAKECAK